MKQIKKYIAIKIILSILIFSLISFFYFKISYARYLLPFGTPKVISSFPCLNGGFMAGILPTIPIANPPGIYYFPLGSNRYENYLPPLPGVKMVGKYFPGGVCWIPGFYGPIPIPTIGTVIEYGSSLPGF